MKYQTKIRVVEAITFDELVEYGRSVTSSSHLMSCGGWNELRGAALNAAIDATLVMDTAC